MGESSRQRKSLLQRYMDGFASLVRALSARLRVGRSPAMIGTPPSKRNIGHPYSANPAAHAAQFAIEYADRFEVYVEGRMHALDIPDDEIGYSDRAHDVAWRVFFPHDQTGGGVAGGRIAVDSGVLNVDLLTKSYGPEAGAVWAKARLRDRIDAIIAHEHHEAAGLTHAQAVRVAPDTSLPITREARRILRAMAEAERTR